jgi:adenosine deaminase
MEDGSMMHTKDDFLRAIPKTDLHLHLDGSLRLSTLIELAKDKKIELPSWTESGLRETVFKEKYNSLDEYLQGFDYTTAVMNDEESMERVSYELAWDNFNEGVRYIEIRLAPQLHIRDGFSFEDIMRSIDRGLKKAQGEINARIAMDEPEFDYGIIVCAMRFCNGNFSEYYKKFFDMHKYSTAGETIKLASLELVKAAVLLRDTSDVRIVGFDIAGSERGYPASNHMDSYAYAHKNFMHKTVHAGEAYGPESIFTAITKCHADRIGHGLFLFREDLIRDESITDKKRYIENLANYIADRRITIEVCLTSNMQTNPDIKNIKDHSLGKMLDQRLSISFCTDNRLVSHTSVCGELRLALDNFDISDSKLKDIIVYGFKRSFYYGSYSDKRKYVRKCINYYDKVSEQFARETDQR